MKRKLPIKPKSRSAKCVGAQTHELEPLVQLWMKKNPHAKPSHLVRLGLKLALKPIAGKRYAHLVEV